MNTTETEKSTSSSAHKGRYFTLIPPDNFKSDALYVAYFDETSSGRVMTPTGWRDANWHFNLHDALTAVSCEILIEITSAQATAILLNS